ncbi:MAG TPA: hypothetical protein ENI07_07525 [Desulfobacterales bacterium]|nr:hypothetical protein [Desulfobacterales bacterium]
MKINRRRFLGVAGTVLGGNMVVGTQKFQATRRPKAPSNPYGCVVDLTWEFRTDPIIFAIGFLRG